MTNDLVLDRPSTATEQRIKRPATKSLKRRSPLSASELNTIRELPTAGASASEIAGKLDDRPTRTVRSAMRAMGLVVVTTPPSEPLVEPPSSEPPLPAKSAPEKRSKARQPFSPGERAAIERLARNGVAANEIAKTINRGRNFPQVAHLVRQLGLGKMSSVPVQISDSKGTCPEKTWAALAAAARRRSVKPALLAVQIIDRVVRHGSVDAVLRDDAAALVDDLRNVQLVLNLEAVGRANGACRDYRLRGVAVTHGERPG